VAGVVAVIPARGGSRRLPGKNLIPIAGKPLLVHTVEQALAASRVDLVVVSTDDAEIAAVARAAGATVVDRPAELASDHATSESAVLHALDALGDADPEIAVLLQATSPVRLPSDIDAAVALVADDHADSVFSAVRGHVWLWEQHDDGPRSISYDWRARPRSQDTAPQLMEDGSIYVSRTALLRASGNRLGGRIAAHVMAADSAIDLDDAGQLEALESAMARLSGR
jgi:CMP-N,N'-diacetyllegionaminic acid synthase